MEYKDLLQRVLRREAGLPELVVHSVKEAPCTQPGQNFMSVVSVIEVEATLPNGVLYNQSVFVKRPPDPADHKLPFSVDDAFSNEVLMYRRVLPLYVNIKVACARCLHAAAEVIVLEDLRAEGYYVEDRARGFDLPTVQHILKELAKFHAASYHMRIVKKEAFELVTSELNSLGLIVSSNKGLVESCLQRVISYTDNDKDLNGVAISLRKIQGKVIETMRHLRDGSTLAVLCHGDFWLNNILMRKNKVEGAGSENHQIRIIDLQTCAILSPAVDFWHLLYTSISPMLLKTHCDNFIQLYSYEFARVLNSLDVPVDKIPSMTTIKEELSKKEMYGFLVAMVYLPALYINVESIPEIEQTTEQERMEEGFLDRFLSSEFRERLLEVMRYCSERGVCRRLSQVQL